MIQDDSVLLTGQARGQNRRTPADLGSERVASPGPGRCRLTHGQDLAFNVSPPIDVCPREGWSAQFVERAFPSCGTMPG